MKGFIKTDAIDGWLDKGNGITTIYMSNGIAESITKDELICIGGSNKG